MYCKYCGKPTDNQDGVCQDCLIGKQKQEDNFFDEPPTNINYANQQSPEEINKRFGFGPALASTILGSIGYVVAIIILETLAIFIEYHEDFSSLIAVSILCLAMGVVSLILGIKSIQRFKTAKNKGVKPIPTLILGIVGVVSAAVTLFIWFIFFCLILYI